MVATKVLQLVKVSIQFCESSITRVFKEVMQSTISTVLLHESNYFMMHEYFNRQILGKLAEVTKPDQSLIFILIKQKETVKEVEPMRMFNGRE